MAFSSNLGKKSVRDRSQSVTMNGSENQHSHERSHHWHYQIRELINPDELMQMKRKKCVMVMEGETPVFANKVI